MIIAQGINKSYINHDKKEELVFENLDFRAKRGELTTIMGASGSGKTSLLNIISTIDKIQKGSLIINGENINRLNSQQKANFRAKNIGFIFQSFSLIPEFNIIENCMIPLYLNGFSKKDANIKVEKMIDKFFDGIDMKKYPAQLSGGQQQRVSIIRALIHSPSIIIADEPKMQKM